ncbi:MAG: RraA family protein [Planctomycetota bacterium]|nr:MAG: RraA family protein [Planctomycetota bacterium]REJ89756.1 MAG: RraA family protein [Planctomycetota bacterium]REK26419.1 MAG: RraA family protein [Planctomycetota bacterium]REK32052.1 MAG: RraA family protein [Planctomycetota bacterium]
MSTPQVSADCLKQLAAYDTPTVCNVIELFDVRPRNAGFMNETIRACFPKLPPMVGFAVTTTFRSAAPPRSGSVYAGLRQQIEAFGELPGPAVVVFQDLDEPTCAATFGEVMCTTYQSFGAAGLITSGAGRDLEQVEDIGFPAFTNGTICSHGYCHMLQMNVPVTVGGIVVEPGDLLHGDCNGVSTIPVEIASEIPDACQELMDAEKIILDYVKSGSITADGFSEAREASQSAIDKLGIRLRGK